MKKTLALAILLVSIVALSFAGCGTKQETNTKVTDKVSTTSANTNKEGSKELKINTTDSEVLWHGEKVVGKHDGKVKIKDGVVNVKDGKIVGGMVTVDLSTITDTDITDEATNQKLVGHLKSEDFFDIAKFPVSTLEITEVTPIQNSAAGQPNYTVKGNLTIRGVTKGITFPASITISDSKVTSNATFDIDRTEFGLKYGSGKFFEGLGDKMIKDNFTMTYKISAGN